MNSKFNTDRLVMMFKSENSDDVRLAFEYSDRLSKEQKKEVAFYLWGAFDLALTFGNEKLSEIDSWRYLETKNKENEIK